VSLSESSRPAREPQAATTSRLASIPSPARFILVVLSSLAVSSVLFTFTSALTVGDLGPISKHLEEWWEVGGLIGWRAIEVGLAWILGYDGEYCVPRTMDTAFPTPYIHVQSSCSYADDVQKLILRDKQAAMWHRSYS
jgi:hypothetical protein